MIDRAFLFCDWAATSGSPKTSMVHGTVNRKSKSTRKLAGPLTSAERMVYFALSASLLVSPKMKIVLSPMLSVRPPKLVACDVQKHLSLWT